MNKEQNYTILIVDDIPENIQVLKGLLTKQGYTIKGVTDGQSAIQAAKVLSPNIILLDIMMPDMDGFDVCSILKSTPELKDIPVIFITAMSDTDSKVKAFEIGGSDYITKPFQSQEVLARVKSQLQVSVYTKMLKTHNISLIEKVNKLDEEKLQAMTLLNTAFEQTDIGMGFIGKEGKILSINHYFTKLLGYSEPKELEGCSFLGSLLQYEHSQLETLFAKLNDEQLTYFSIEHKYYKYNKHKWINIIISKISHQITNEISHIMIGKDITEDKKKDQLLYQQSKMAAMGEMIANIAHQWRQPLSVISTAATGMLLNKQFNKLSDADFEKNCILITENSKFLSKTIDDFRSFFQQDKKKITFNLYETLKKVEKLVDASLKNDDIKLLLDVKNNVQINNFENEFMQAILNIINNAKDALKNKENTQYKMIELKTTLKEKNKIKIEIKDNGGGIQKEIKDSIFDPYITTKHKSQGTGIGLYMTYQIIVEHMKGSIKADNVEFDFKDKVYTGAKFTITLEYKDIL